MMMYPVYKPLRPEDAETFLRQCLFGRLVSTSAEGQVSLGLFNFVYDEARATVELHLNKSDGQIRDLLARPDCLFEMDEFLSLIPSYWVDERNGGRATMYYQCALLRCQASIVESREELLVHLKTLLTKYQPQGGYVPLGQDSPVYQEALGKLTLVRLHVRSREFKFKVGQNNPKDVRERVAGHLEERAEGRDPRAAEYLRATLRK